MKKKKETKKKKKKRNYFEKKNTYRSTTELKLPKEGKLIDYLEEYVRFYQHIWRRVYEDFVRGVYKNIFHSDQKEYIKFIYKKFGILSRTANSIVRDVKGRLKALLELKKTELSQMRANIKEREEEIEELAEDVKVLKEQARKGELDQRGLEELRRSKEKLYYLRNALNTRKDKLKKLEEMVRSGRVTFTFGSKKLFNAQFHLGQTKYKSFDEWKEAHDFALNHIILFVGRNDEAYGNQMVQMRPQKDGTYTLHLNKDLPFRKEGEPDFIEVEGLKLKYMNEEIQRFTQAKTVEMGKRAIAARFIKREKGWYLQLMFEYDLEESWCLKSNGVVAIDTNDAMLAVAELSWDGNLVNHFTIPLKHHKEGGRALAEVRDVAKWLAEYAYSRGKPVVMENLNFEKKKAKTKHGKNKKYNTMIHSMDYSRIKECLERACGRAMVRFLKPVNPAYTSLMGKQNYMGRMKVVIHISAAYVIGRRAMGFHDKCISKGKEIII